MTDRLARIGLVIALTGALIGCSEEAPPADTPAAQETAEPAAGADGDAMADYPIDYCLVSGEKLGEMGDPVEVTVEGRTVWLCCEMCKDDLLDNPSEYLAKLDAAAAGDAATHESEARQGEHQH